MIATRSKELITAFVVSDSDIQNSCLISGTIIGIKVKGEGVRTTNAGEVTSGRVAFR